MPQLHINDSFGDKKEKSPLQQLLKGMASVKSSISNTTQQTHGTPTQSLQFGLAAALGLGGVFVAASRINKKVKQFQQGIKALTSAFSGDSDDVEEESVFTRTEQTKQPGFFGIAGLAKFGFSHVVKAIKVNRNKEEKDKKSLLRKILEGIKRIFKSKWFWGSLLVSALGFGIWNLISSFTKDDDLEAVQREAARNRTLIEDSDFLSDANEEAFFEEFDASLKGIHDAKSVVRRKWKQDLDKLNKEKILHPNTPNFYTSSEVLKSKQRNPNITLPHSANVPMGQAIPLNSPLPSGSYTISSRFGLRDLSSQNKHASRMHKGIDLAAKAGTPVIAPAQGVVTKVGYDRKAGNYIKIKHQNGFETVYAHLQSMNVAEKQQLAGGEIIGQVGNTGLASTGSHLHFGVKKDGEFINPELLMQQETSLTPEARAFNAEMSSNIQESTGLTEAVSKSQQQLAKSYKDLDDAIQYNIKHPLYLATFKKFGSKSWLTKGVKVFDNVSRWADRNSWAAWIIAPSANMMRKLFY